MSDQDHTETPPRLPPPPDVLHWLKRSGWTAVERPYQEYAAGRITYERALADTLAQVHRDWNNFWEFLRRACPDVARRMGDDLCGGYRYAMNPPLAPERLHPIQPAAL